MREEPEVVVLGNLGDKSPLDYGGLIVFRYVNRGKAYIGAEYWDEPLEEEQRKYKVWTAELAPGMDLGEFATREEAIREIRKRLKPVYEMTESSTKVEFWVDNAWVGGAFLDERGEDRYTVYRFDIEDDPVKDLNWADWFAIVDTMGVSVTELGEMSISPNPLQRAELYRMVGDHHGWDNIDGYPLRLSRPEMEERWPKSALKEA